MKRPNVHTRKARKRAFSPRQHPLNASQTITITIAAGTLHTPQKAYRSGSLVAKELWTRINPQERKWLPDWAKWFFTEVVQLANEARTKELVAMAEEYRANPPKMAPLRVGTPFDHRPSKAKPAPKPKTLQEMFGF